MSKEKKISPNAFQTFRRVFLTKDPESGNILDIEEEHYIQDKKKEMKEYRLTALNAMDYNSSDFKNGDQDDKFFTDAEIKDLRKKENISDVVESKADKALKTENESLKAEIKKLKGTKEDSKGESTEKKEGVIGKIFSGKPKDEEVKEENETDENSEENNNKNENKK